MGEGRFSHSRETVRCCWKPHPLHFCRPKSPQDFFFPLFPFCTLSRWSLPSFNRRRHRRCSSTAFGFSSIQGNPRPARATLPPSIPPSLYPAQVCPRVLGDRFRVLKSVITPSPAAVIAPIPPLPESHPASRDGPARTREVAEAQT